MFFPYITDEPSSPLELYPLCSYYTGLRPQGRGVIHEHHRAFLILIFFEFIIEKYIQDGVSLATRKTQTGTSLSPNVHPLASNGTGLPLCNQANVVRGASALTASAVVRLHDTDSLSPAVAATLFDPAAS